MGVLLFVIPVDFRKGIFAMHWKTGEKAVPWDIVLLMGGGFALATGFKATGLDVWLAGHLSILRSAPTWMMILAICARMTFVTEFTSNIASTNAPNSGWVGAEHVGETSVTDYRQRCRLRAPL
jgi:sodium-dependent dicarboxylate transporter 2/3/5